MRHYRSIFSLFFIIIIFGCSDKQLNTSKEILIDISQLGITINDSSISDYSEDNPLIKNIEFSNGIHRQIVYFENRLSISENLTLAELDKMAIKQGYALESDILVLSSKSDSIPFSKNYLDYVDAEIVVVLKDNLEPLSDEMMKFLGLVKRCEIVVCPKNSHVKFRGNGSYWEKVL